LFGELIVAVTRIESGSRYSQAVIVGDLVFIAGQVPGDSSQDITGQMRQTLAALDRILEAVGSGRDQLVSVTVYLRDIIDYAAMNAVWDAWIVSDATPARVTVEARLALPEYRVEVQAVAALPA
jgi:enamine deaminase RidA (YjgF/YER057c/UK114 family)